MADPPSTIKDFIAALRSDFVCGACGRYVGSLAAKRYLPAPYPVAIGKLGEDEVEALIGFEWHMLQRMRQGNFTLRHPQRAGRCVSMKEWLAGEEDDEETGA